MKTSPSVAFVVGNRGWRLGTNFEKVIVSTGFPLAQTRFGKPWHCICHGYTKEVYDGCCCVPEKKMIIGKGDGDGFGLRKRVRAQGGLIPTSNDFM